MDWQVGSNASFGDFQLYIYTSPLFFPWRMITKISATDMPSTQKGEILESTLHYCLHSFNSLLGKLVLFGGRTFMKFPCLVVEHVCTIHYDILPKIKNKKPICSRDLNIISINWMESSIVWTMQCLILKTYVNFKDLCHSLKSIQSFM